MIQFFVWSLVEQPQRIGQIITAELSFKNSRAILISLYKEKHGEDSGFRIIKELMNRAGKIEEKRNQIIHSVWAVGKDANSIKRIKTTAKEKCGLRFKYEDITADDLAEIADDIKKLTSEIQNFYLALMDEEKKKAVSLLE